MGRHYSDEEKPIASQNLPTRTLQKRLAEAGYVRSIGSIDRWRQVNRVFRSSKKITEKPKPEPKPKEPNRFPSGVREFLLYG